MAWWNFRSRESARAEQRASIEDPTVPISSANILDALAIGGISATGVRVSLENAMGVPAIWAAVNFISGTMAGLPLHLFENTADGVKKSDDDLSSILHDAVNDECSSFDWRKYSFERTLSGGRQLTYIERSPTGKIIGLFPLEPSKVTVRMVAGKKKYIYRPRLAKPTTYNASEIIDIPFMLKADMVTALSPIMAHKDTIGLAIAATTFGSRLFNNGGIPPFIISGNFQSGAAAKRASNDLEEAVMQASRENRQALAIPKDHTITPLGVDPEKAQLVELKKFIIQEVARIYSLPPNFLQDLSTGTFSNVEQQDLHLVKHTIKRWAEQAEQEYNLKMFGFGNKKYFVKYNLDGLMRGDLKSRMESYARGINNAVLTPNEARALENRSADPQGNVLLIQGATVPLGSQPVMPTNPAGDNDDASTV